MRSRDKQAGFLTFTGVIMILVVGAFFFTAFKLGPPYISNYQFQDSINNIARTATYSNVAEEVLRKEVMASARDVGVTLDPAQLRIGRSRESVDISADYTVTVDMLVKPVTLHFTPSAGNKLITAK